MKKHLMVMIVFLLVLCFFTALAKADSSEIIESLGTLSIEELIAIQDAVKAEIASRPENTFSVITPGFYDIGTDILPGEYFFLFDKSQDGSHEGDVYIYKNHEDFEKGYEAYSKSRVLYRATLYKGGDSVRLTFSEGNVIVVEDASVLIAAADFSDEIKQLYVIPDKAKEVPLGSYIVGTDIQAGRFTAYVPVGGRGTVRIYDSYEKFSAGDYSMYYNLRSGSLNATFELSEGQVMEIREYAVFICKAESKMLTFD